MLLSSDGGFSLPYRSGLWGWDCRSSPTEKENCVLRCLSLECYDLIYGGDPVSGGIRMWGFSSCDILDLLIFLLGCLVQLEEGELDYVRGQEYKYCMHK